MSAYANGLQKPESFDSYVRKFRVICVTHEIPIGSPANLPLFLQKLINDRHLAMDFWGFVGKLSDREGGELTDDQLLAVVVEGVAKSEVPPEDSNLRQTVDDLRAMLGGVDIHSPGQLEPEPFSRDATPSQQGEEPWQPNIDAFRHAAPVAIDARTIPPSADSPSASLPPIPPQLDEALQRLELTNLELRHHLEAIDRKMSRLEPHLERPAAIGADRNEQIGRTSANSTVPQREELAHRAVGQPRLVLKSATPRADLSFTRERDDLQSRVPLESYSQRQGYGRALTALLLVLILAAAAFAGYRYRAPLQEEWAALVQKIQARNTNTSTSPPSTQNASQNSTPEDASAGPAQQDQTSPPQQAPQRAFTSPAQGSNTPTLQTPPAGSRTPAAASDSVGTRRSIADRIAAAQAPQSQPDGISSADLAGAVRVAPAAMEARLVDSRVPAYPDSAKTQGVEGSVVMQAIISRDGTVKRVHVLQGDSRLRTAAMEAVYKWRYRPYLLNGQPVDVATTITVDFDLER